MSKTTTTRYIKENIFSEPDIRYYNKNQIIKN
jgi:hypothetical protein